MDGTVRLTLSDGSDRRVDHVLLATGFRVDIGRYAFLPEDLLRAVNRVDGSPRLSHGFESTLPGLYFLGAPAAWSFGPLMRFVAQKGSVALDGVSLTVNEVTTDTFSVLIIPHTLSVTTLGATKPGDHINLEIDMMARYAARLMETR